jgi:hypothetical protein
MLLILDTTHGIWWRWSAHGSERREFRGSLIVHWRLMSFRLCSWSFVMASVEAVALRYCCRCTMERVVGIIFRSTILRSFSSHVVHHINIVSQARDLFLESFDLFCLVLEKRLLTLIFLNSYLQSVLVLSKIDVSGSFHLWSVFPTC